MSTEITGCTPIHSSDMDLPKKDRPPGLEEIKQQIISCQEDIERTYLKVGQLLWEAKEHFGKHGKWLEWLKNNVDMSICKVQRLMKVARWMDGNEAPELHLTFTQAYILCRLSQKELEEFGEFISGMEKVKGMSKRELEAKVRDFLKLKSGKSSVVQAPQQAEIHASDKHDLVNRLNQIKIEVSKIASLVDGDSDEYDVYTADLCEVCRNIVQQFSPEEAGNM